MTREGGALERPGASGRHRVSEPEGRGAAWTQQRGTSDEGRRRSAWGMGGGGGSLVIPSRQPRLSMSVKALWLGASVAPPGQKALTSINIYWVSKPRWSVDQRSVTTVTAAAAGRPADDRCR